MDKWLFITATDVNELSNYLDKIYREDEEKFDVLSDYLHVFDDYGDNFAHTLRELQLVRVYEEYTGENNVKICTSNLH